MQPIILIVEDEETFRTTLAQTLRDEGYIVYDKSTAIAALELLEEQPADIIVTDVRMPGMDGIEFLARVNEHNDADVIVMSAFGTVDTAVDAMRRGAADYIIKPFLFDDLILRIKRLWDYRNLARINTGLRREIEAAKGYADIVGTSDKMQSVYSLIERVGPTNSNVLITGESGTGKELVARAIHNAGVGKDAPFIPVNCCALPESLAESVLFGHLKGSFTGAIDNSIGLFEAATGGTLFLDEISSSSAAIQAKLLRACDRKEILPVGAKLPTHVDVRLIAATNRNLKDEAAEGRFRDDLYYRLSVVEINLPALRERKEDIPVLAEYFAEKCSVQLKRDCGGISRDAIAKLMRYDWPGNVRELENVIERATIIGTGDTLHADDIATALGTGVSEMPSEDALKSASKKFLHNHISAVLRKARNDKNLAAEMLGIGLSSLYRKIEELDIDVG